MKDDITKLAGSALSLAANAKHDLEAMVKNQLQQVLTRMDVVSREEFEVVKAMATKAREENEILKARLDALGARK
jgi:BMFP domain-containing protein YqiC